MRDYTREKGKGGTGLTPQKDQSLTRVRSVGCRDYNPYYQRRFRDQLAAKEGRCDPRRRMTEAPPAGDREPRGVLGE